MCFAEKCQNIQYEKYKIEFAKKDVDGNAPTMAFMFNPVKIDGIWYLCIKSPKDEEHVQHSLA